MKILFALSVADDGSSIDVRTIDIDYFEPKQIPAFDAHFYIRESQATRSLIRCTKSIKTSDVDGHDAVVCGKLLRVEPAVRTKEEVTYMDDVKIRHYTGK